MPGSSFRAVDLAQIFPQLEVLTVPCNESTAGLSKYSVRLLRYGQPFGWISFSFGGLQVSMPRGHMRARILGAWSHKLGFP